MRKALVTGMILGMTVLAALEVDSAALAQSQERGSDSRQGKRKMTHDQFREAFWTYLTKGPSAYKQWLSLDGKEVAQYEGQSPHGAFLKLYANQAARSNPKVLPAGSILVKENYGKDGKTLMAVTVMYHSKGYDPQHHDWYWIKYMPNGKVAKTPPDKGSRPISGRFASCINCHGDAEGGDYAYAND